MINQRATAMIEYVFMAALLIGGLAVMQPFIQRAFTGSWKKSGDTFGYGRQFQATKTAECAYSQINATFGVWYDNTCYEQLITTCAPQDHDCENTQKSLCTQPYCCEGNTLSNTNCD